MTKNIWCHLKLKMLQIWNSTRERNFVSVHWKSLFCKMYIFCSFLSLKVLLFHDIVNLLFLNNRWKSHLLYAWTKLYYIASCLTNKLVTLMWKKSTFIASVQYCRMVHLVEKLLLFCWYTLHTMPLGVLQSLNDKLIGMLLFFSLFFKWYLELDCF